MSVPADISPEITFHTARSGGKGGQNVNKVETMVEGYFDINGSRLLSPEQKATLLAKLKNRINTDGVLQVRSQVHRSQLSNRNEVLKKIHLLLRQALKKEKPRIRTKPSKTSRLKRLESKKITSERKDQRKKIRRTDRP